MLDYWTFVIEKKITSSTLTTSDVNIAEFVWDGVIIEDVVAVTDSTWLAGGTNFQLKANGILFFVTTVASLWASTPLDLNGATVTGVKWIIGNGSQYISVSNTVAVGTGAGVITLKFICRKLAWNVSWNAI